MEKDTAEYKFANKSFYSHHPAAENWVNHTVGHNFFLCKLNISFISVLDGYGGPHVITADEYFNVELESTEEEHLTLSDSSKEYSLESNDIFKYKRTKNYPKHSKMNT